MTYVIGVDIGGTFTDVVLADETTGAVAVVKVPTTPRDFAQGVVDATGVYGPWVLLGATFLLTTVFTCIMTNNAAAVLMFPIALGITQEAGLSFLPFAVVIAVAASCEFSTPIGYQTNLMVMGPGGYKWIDYTRFGGPLTILCGIVCVALAPLVYGPLEAPGGPRVETEVVGASPEPAAESGDGLPRETTEPSG